MKRILMTNLYFGKYTGSELHILEMARCFEKKGYEVTVAVYQKSYPLLEEANGIQILECQKEKLKTTYYDIVFVQHFPVFDYLCCQYEISYTHLIVSRLSVINALESLPVCLNEADMILCVSDECADTVRDEIGQDERIQVFPNCAGPEFFDAFHIENKKALKRIAVISNHVPEEVLQLTDRLGNYEMDLIGVGYEPRRVTADLLKEYDLVITIGRTVQSCFAAGIPVYVYDYFGGPGYITAGNIALAEKHNFSGRGFEKKDVEELARDIVNGYDENQAQKEWLHIQALERYNYTKKFDEIYSRLTETTGERKVADYYNQVEKKRISTYADIVPLIIGPNSNQTTQVYRGGEEGFCESDSITWQSAVGYKIEKEIELDSLTNTFRFDPCKVPCRCKIYDVIINGTSKKQLLNPVNAFENAVGEDIFLSFDPQYLFAEELGHESHQVKFIFKIEELNESELIQLVDSETGEKRRELDERIKELEQKAGALERELRQERDKSIRQRIKERILQR